jgi:SAM-dependent methyltransferase
LSLLLYFRYFLISVRQRGLKATLLIPFYEWKYERFFKIKTSGIVKSDSDQYFHYQGVTYFTLFKLKEILTKYAHTHVFCDIGCGKGRALVVAEYFGYEKIYGIELDAELAKTAQTHLNQHAFAKENTFKKITCANAALTEYPDAPCVFFLFNPFDGEILNMVLTKIEAGLKHDHIYIYVNPLYKEVFIQKGYRQEKEISTHNYTEAIVYSRS